MVISKALFSIVSLNSFKQLFQTSHTSIIFSFQELREVRVAFQLYEHEDMLGLVIDEHVLLRTLKVSYIYIWTLLENIKYVVIDGTLA